MSGAAQDRTLDGGEAGAEAAKRPSPSMARAIRDKCRDCCYDELAAGTWLMQVEACTCFACPLWPVHPIRKPGGPWPGTVIQEMGVSDAYAAFRAENPYTVPDVERRRGLDGTMPGKPA